MSSSLVIAPHPDDELLGCGASLLREVEEGKEIHWLIMTKMRPSEQFPEQTISQRNLEIQNISKTMGFSSTRQLDFYAAELDTYRMIDIIDSIGEVIKTINPATLYLPFKGDVHSDHLITFNAAKSCAKWFRFPSVKRIYCYETVSETDQGLSSIEHFVPNRYVDVTSFIEKKIEILKIYDSEFGLQPFPRSPEIIRSQAALRGSQCGVEYAEAFSIMKEIV